jgi:hypothetical protein
MGGACSTCGRDRKNIQKLLSENLKRQGHLEYLGVDGKII